MDNKTINGFSKLSKKEKIQWLSKNYLTNNTEAEQLLSVYWHEDSARQKRHDEFIENALSNFFLPFAVAPNFNIDGRIYAIPMVIEESSVVAAASNAAKFWLTRGGFKTEILSTVKSGQIHLNFSGASSDLMDFFNQNKGQLMESISDLSQSMIKRGAGLLDLTLVDQSHKLSNYFFIDARFKTADAMGANYINSCLETIAEAFRVLSADYTPFKNQIPEVVMSILSNYVPECLVRVSVQCPVNDLAQSELSGAEFAEKFVRAVNIAQTNPLRAVTHNKGIMNGVDAVILATGNDFRAVEAGIHAFASKTGTYKSLSNAQVKDQCFEFSMELPLAIGTVGGLTKLHPMVGVAMSMLQEPSAEDLMKIVATAGLAQNFAAVRSLVTTGIQKGHMKMHLLNLLSQYDADDSIKSAAVEHFKTHTISARSVADFVVAYSLND